MIMTQTALNISYVSDSLFRNITVLLSIPQCSYHAKVKAVFICVCANRNCACLQCVPYPQYHFALAGGAVCRCRTHLQQEEQHITQRRDTICGSR